MVQMTLTNLTADRRMRIPILLVLIGLLSAVCGQKFVKRRFQKA